VRRLLGAGLVMIALLAWAAPTRAAQTRAARPSTPLSHQGRWLVDPQGRIVLLHGVNAVWKLPPYVAPDTPGGFTAADADFLARNGLDAVRLGVLFSGVMPKQGQIDSSYLDSVDRIVRLLAARHIWVLLDFHQDLYNEMFQGEGFPAWSVHDSGLPNDARYGFPGNYFLSQALDRTYDNLWADTDHTWTYYRAAWQAVASRWAGDPYLMGYDVFNEPWPGTGWQTCFSLATGCPGFDHTLQRFEDEARAGIRQADPTHLVFFEGNVISNSGPPSHLGDTPVADSQLGFSWHDYCGSSAVLGSGGPDCATEEQFAFDNAETTDRRLGAGFLMSEFGSSDDIADLSRMTALADQHLVGWTYWAYKAWKDPTGSPAHEGLFTNDADLSTLKQDKADVLIRPHPNAVAGIPLSLHFDGTSHVLDFSYTPRPAAGPTEIFTPSRHYPNGYVVNVRGAHMVSPPNAPVLQLVADPGATTVDVEVRPLPATTG
jgi:endoglycosylceramidase